jgi:ABC-2 type transport system ATP-binding protein
MILTRGLTKTFKIGKKQKELLTAVEDLNLEIPRGEVFGFLGPNGAGKTTTVRMLTSLIHPSAGQARVNGYSLGLDDNAIRRSVGILTESPGLYERLSAEKNLRIYAELYEVPNPEAAVSKYLSVLGLWERRLDPAGSFSKGMRQKLAVARALLHEPPLLFLDEPTAGLDPEAAKLVREFIEELKREGRTIFLTTHNLDEADRLCDRIGIFNQCLLAQGAPSTLRTQLFGRKSVFHLAAVNPDWLPLILAQRGVLGVEEIENKILVRSEDLERDNPEITRALVNAGADIRFIGELRQPLETVYLDLLHQKSEQS